jgi:excisionase family DNA binding protein
MACNAILFVMYLNALPLARSRTLVHRKVLGPSIGGGRQIYADAKALPFARLALGDLLDSADVCQLFPCSARSLYRWVAEGHLRPTLKIGRQYLFTKSELVRWWAERPRVGRPPGEG